MSYFLLLFLAVAAGLSYIRFSRIDCGQFHMEISLIPESGKPNQYRLTAEAAPIFDRSAKALFQELQDFISQNTNAKMCTQSENPFLVSAIERSKWLGFPDLITAQITPAGENRARIEIVSQARFGYSDFGVNKARVEKWLADLRTRMN